MVKKKVMQVHKKAYRLSERVFQLVGLFIICCFAYAIYQGLTEKTEAALPTQTFEQQSEERVGYAKAQQELLHELNEKSIKMINEEIYKLGDRFNKNIYRECVKNQFGINVGCKDQGATIDNAKEFIVKRLELSF